MTCHDETAWPLVVTGKGEESEGTSKTEVSGYSLTTRWKGNVSPIQLIRASEDRELWHHMVANVVYDGTAL